MPKPYDYDLSIVEISELQELVDKAIETDIEVDGRITYENGLLYLVSDILWDIRFGKSVTIRCTEKDDEKV